jgi:voltage-gated potassium channel
MEQKITGLRNHYIICGYERAGRAVCKALHTSAVPFVVIEHLPEGIQELAGKEWPAVEGDATEDEILHSAAIGQARGIVAVLGRDAKNALLVLSARALNPDLNIVSWATSEEAEAKILRAGADHVLSPHALVGKQFATLLTTPHALGAEAEGDIRVGEFEIRSRSSMIGNSAERFGFGGEVGVIGIRYADGKLEFNPPPTYALRERDVLIVAGNQDQIERFRKLML